MRAWGSAYSAYIYIYIYIYICMHVDRYAGNLRLGFMFGFEAEG